MMFRTALTATFDLSCPVLSAGMPFAARPPLVAAVSNAGGMGFLAADLTSPPEIAAMIRTTRRLTSRPFGVSFSTPCVSDELLACCADEKPAVVAFARGQSHGSRIDELRDVGIAVWRHVASPGEGRLAARQGVDGVIVDGGEATGDAASWPLLRLLPAVGETVSPIPMIAAGGIRDGRRLAAALVLGADAAWCGARFLASTEVVGLRHERPAVVGARPFPFDASSSTARTLPGSLALGSFAPCASTVSPLVARSSGGYEVKPAAEIVRELSREALSVLAALHSSLCRAPTR